VQLWIGKEEGKLICGVGGEENINAGAPLDVWMLLNFLHTPPHKQPLLYLRRISNCD
jgi:hypothetical protein